MQCRSHPVVALVVVAVVYAPAHAARRKQTVAVAVAVVAVAGKGPAAGRQGRGGWIDSSGSGSSSHQAAQRGGEKPSPQACYRQHALYLRQVHYTYGYDRRMVH